MSKTILITGGAGFVGSNLCINFKKAHPAYTVIALDSLRRRGSELNVNRLKAHEVQFIHGDIRNPEDLDIPMKPDVVIDASADPSVLSGISSPVYPLLSSNLIGTINCLGLADRHGAAFIFLSTSRVYPVAALESCNYRELATRYEWTDEQDLPGVSSKGITEDFPLTGSRSFYGSSKLASELLIEEYHALKGMKTVINRCGVISGPWQMGKVDQGVLVLWLARHYFKGSLNYIGYGAKGKQLRDVMHADDLFALIDHEVHHPEVYDGRTFNVGGGADVSFSLAELTDICSRVTGNKISIAPMHASRPADIRIYVSDCSRLHAHTGWKPAKSLEDIVADTFSWMQENEKDLRHILA